MRYLFQYIFRYFVARTLYYIAKVILRLAGRALVGLLHGLRHLWTGTLSLYSRFALWLHFQHPYFLGYRGLLLPRWLRRTFARTHLHRSWLAGYMGIYFNERGRHYGVCDRVWYRPRVKQA